MHILDRTRSRITVHRKESYEELKKLVLFLANWLIGGFTYLSDPTSRNVSLMNSPEIPEELLKSSDEEIRKLLDKVDF